jgi:hypothetical protein
MDVEDSTELVAFYHEVTESTKNTEISSIGWEQTFVASVLFVTS